MYYIDVRTDMPWGHKSIVIFVDKCNMRCSYCDYKTMLKYISKCVDSIDGVISYVNKSLSYGILDSITLTGGEPMEDLELIDSILTKVKCDNKFIYTNLSYDYRLGDFDKVFVDVKGCDVSTVKEVCKCDDKTAQKIIDNYMKYKDSDKFTFRIRKGIKCSIDFKNTETYEVKKV